MLFSLSRRVPLDPHVVDSLHILHTFGVLTTDKQQILMVVVLSYHRLCQQYRQMFILSHQPTQR